MQMFAVTGGDPNAPPPPSVFVDLRTYTPMDMRAVPGGDLSAPPPLAISVNLLNGQTFTAPMCNGPGFGVTETPSMYPLNAMHA